jgi:tetratricopeptide (TPR) repeat protein
VDALAERLASRLQADPNDAEAYGALKAYYRDTGDLASLTNLIEGWAAFQADPVRAAQGYLEAAQVVGSSGKHPERRRELLQQATQKDIANREAVFELIALMSEQGDAHTLAEFLDQHLRAMEEQPHDRSLMAALYARLGALWGAQFERADVARRCYERAVELNPTATEISDAAHKLAQDSGDKAFLARLYELEAAAEPARERKLQLYLQQAALAGEVADLDGAVQGLRAALNIASSDVAIMHQLASALNRRAAKQSGESATRDLRRVSELHYQIAQAVAPEDALDYLEAALTATPNHDGALHLMEQLAETFGRPEVLPKYWLGYLAHAGEGPELDRRRVYMAKAYEQAGQLDDAIFCLEQVRTEGMAAQQLSELKARRGPRPASQAPRAAAADGDAPDLAADPERNEQPTAKPPIRARTSSAERPLDVAPLVRELRRRVRDAISARRSEEAVKYCGEILELEPGDPEAFALLESHYRKTRDHARLRELLLVSTQISGVPVDLRKQRLREVAAISEAKLKDVEGAIEVWRSVVALDPADVDASKSLKRLLQRTGRWDELAGVLEREALANQNSAEKVELLSQIAAIHRDKRKDPFEAAEALRQLLALRPDTATRDELCDMLLSIGSYADAVPLLRERASEASGEREQLRLLRLLAETLQSKLNDPEAAYEVYRRILALRPKESEALECMQHIDEQSGNTMRLLDTLERRAALVLRGDRATLLAQMADIADRELDDVERAAGYYAKALELEPGREGTLDALSHMFERKQRYADLAELLLQAAAAERDPARRIQLQLRRARLLREPLARPVEAARVYREILDSHENAEAVGFLLETARGGGDSEAVAALSGQLATLVDDPQERRALLYERAQVLVTELGRPRDAIRALRDIVEKVDPEFEPAIDWLLELSSNLGDNAALASALSVRLARSRDSEARLAVAQRLADLDEHELGDRDGAITALLAWADTDRHDVAPHRRLRRLLEDAGRFEELVATCHALASLEDDFNARDRATLDAAQIAFTQLRNIDAAWNRLVPLIEDGLPEALQLLSVVARSAGRSEALAALYVRAAQEAKSVEIQGRLWAAAVRTYADDLNNPIQALEAALRLLASDLKSRDYLTQVEDCAAQANGWTRVAPVYDRLLKAAADDGERIELLTRYADLLEIRAKNPSNALDRVLHACALSPDDENLIARAERLAQRSKRGHELLAMCEEQSLASDQPATKVDWLLRAARFSVSTLADRARAGAYLAAALAATQAESELWEQVVRAAVQLDTAHDEGEPQAMLRELMQAHRQIAEVSPAPVGASLLLRASRLAVDRLDDPRAAFDILRQGSGLFPLDETLYDALLERAEALGRLDALDAHLARAVDEAMDPKSAAALLARRARLLEGSLGRPEDAADVFAKLLRLRPDDLQAAGKLRDSLRRARRFQDLLLVIHKQMQRVKNADEKLELLKESAQVWELDLKNRWEALDAWRKVAEFAPRDAEARRAVVRLDRRSVQPPSDETEVEESAREAAADERELAAADSRPIKPEPDMARSGEDYAEPMAEPSTSERHSEPVVEPSTSERHSEPVAELSTSALTSREVQFDEDDIPSAEITPIDDSEASPEDATLEVDLKLVERAIATRPSGRRSTPPPPPPNGPSRRRASALLPTPRGLGEPSRPGSVPPPVPPNATASRPDVPSRSTPSLPPPVPTRKT